MNEFIFNHSKSQVELSLVTVLQIFTKPVSLEVADWADRYIMMVN